MHSASSAGSLHYGAIQALLAATAMISLSVETDRLIPVSLVL